MENKFDAITFGRFINVTNMQTIQNYSLKFYYSKKILKRQNPAI